jgi:aminopeptidase N
MVLTSLAAAVLLLAVNDTHSFGNINEVRQKHISLEMNLDFERKVIDGICTITLEYVQKDAPHIDLDTRKLIIRGVTDGDGKPLDYALHHSKHEWKGTRLRVMLPESRPEKITVHYESDPGAGALQWLPPELTTSKKYPFIFTQNQPILGRTWIPCQDSPAARVTYDATVRAPQGVRVIMSAMHEEHDEVAGVYKFKLDLPIPTYLIALAAGELVFKATSDRTGVYAEPSVIEAAHWEFGDKEKMVKSAEAMYGEYTWGRWDTVVLPPSFPFGGMENPLLTFATPTLIAGDRSLTNVMAHELAHSWSGNLVTNATWSDFWLNEGFTVYFERRIMEDLYGKDLVEMDWALGLADLRATIDFFTERGQAEYTKLFVDLEGKDPDDAFSTIPYEKGSNLLRILEQHFGRKKFDAFLTKYFNEFAFKSMTTDIFMGLLKERLFKGDEKAWKKLKVEEWVFDAGLPDNVIEPQSDAFVKTGAAAEAVAKSGDMSKINKDWTTSEWLDFINSLPRDLGVEKLKKLDAKYNFKGSGNSEVKAAWYALGIPNTYVEIREPMEAFLVGMGRRKFLSPLYRAMMANPETKRWAEDIYAKGRPGYHPIAVASIDLIMEEGK